MNLLKKKKEAETEHNRLKKEKIEAEIRIQSFQKTEKKSFLFILEKKIWTNLGKNRSMNLN